MINLTSSNQPLEESTSLNSITPSTRESLLRSKLQEIIQGDQACNSLYDNTIITWENIVDRTKSILDEFSKSRDQTTITTFPEQTNVPFPPPDPIPTPAPGESQTTVTDNLLNPSLDVIKDTEIDKRDHTTIVGTDESDYIVGSPTDDLICSEDGNDVIFSEAGVDAIFANGGQDTVQGGVGDNQIFGGDEGDTLVGGIDDDLIVGRAGDDRLFDAEGNDVLEGDAGADVFDCGDGIDIVLGFNPGDGDIINNNCETS